MKNNKSNLYYFVLGMLTMVGIYALYAVITVNTYKLSEKNKDVTTDTSVTETEHTESVEMTAEMDDEDVESEDSGADLINYATDVKEWDVTCNDGKTLKYYTPDTMYSLSDQYLEMLGTAYSKPGLKSDGFIVVGDQSSPSSCNYIINAATLSSTADLLTQISGEETTVENMEMSEAYIYMTTGKLPEDVDDSFVIEEIETVAVGDVSYKVYKLGYDYEYTVSENAAPEIEHVEQLACYSDNADCMEIYVAAQQFNADVALDMLHAFIGYAD